MNDKKKPSTVKLKTLLNDPPPTIIEITEDGQCIVRDYCTVRIEDLKSKLAAANKRVKFLDGLLEEIEKAILHAIDKRFENLREICPDCEDGCNHGIPYDPLSQILRQAAAIAMRRKEPHGKK